MMAPGQDTARALEAGVGVPCAGNGVGGSAKIMTGKPSTSNDAKATAITGYVSDGGEQADGADSAAGAAGNVATNGGAHAIDPEHVQIMKHRLDSSWTLWLMKHNPNNSWKDMQTEVTTFDTAEDFWSLQNHIKPPSELEENNAYFVFKKGIRPLWEDDKNKTGGRWSVCMRRKLVDKIWEKALLFLIGECTNFPSKVCGAEVIARKCFHKISLWTADGRNEEETLEIGAKFRIMCVENRSIKYNLHENSSKGGNTEATYTLP